MAEPHAGQRIGRVLFAAALATAMAAAAIAHFGREPEKAAARAKPRPNIVFILTDDQTVESIRVMDNVKRLLIRQGTTFTTNYATFPLCCPARATLLTGQYPHNNGVLDNAEPRGGYYKLNNHNTLPVWLKRSGYYTAHVGKYLNGYGRRNRTEIPPGWDDFRTAVFGSDTNYFNYVLNVNGRLVRYGANAPAYKTDVFTGMAVDVIRRRARSRKPFFLSVDHVAPHAGRPRESGDPKSTASPVPAPRHRNRFAQEPLPRPPSFNEADVSDKPAAGRARKPLGPTKIAELTAAYRQELESLLALDESVGAIVNALKSSGELRNTLIVFTSDNGYLHGEHRVAQGKVLLYEPSARVPLIMRGPGIRRNARRSQLVANIDIAPTIVAAAHARPQRTMDGRSLFPLIRDRNLQWGRDILLENGAGPKFPGEGATELRGQQYVYRSYLNGERELYRLSTDPDETAGLQNHPAFAGIRDALARRLARLRGCRGRGCRRHPSLKLTLVDSRGRSIGRGRCLSRAGGASLGGHDRRAVSRVGFSVSGRRAGTRGRAPFKRRLDRRLLRPGRRVSVRAQVFLADDRAITVVRRARVCRR